MTSTQPDEDQTCRFRKIVDELESISKGTQNHAKRNGIVFHCETINEDEDMSYSPSHSPFDKERSQIESRMISPLEKLEKVNTFCDHISPFLVEALNYSKITKEAESTILDTICQNAVESTEALVEVMEAFKKESKEMEEVDKKEKLCNELKNLQIEQWIEELQD
ncbi:Protein CBG25607 [Caenorhabditis briggsae]|nr:Protein CBG25607 [Caenorhabditis briggsae]CAR98571.1 Protein CBG25607 [Caenorhabditis briggsae]